MKVTEEFPEIHEAAIKHVEDYNKLLEKIKANNSQIPLFVKTGKGEIHIIPSIDDDIENEIDEKSKLVYLGSKVN